MPVKLNLCMVIPWQYYSFNKQNVMFSVVISHLTPIVSPEEIILIDVMHIQSTFIFMFFQII